MNKIYELNGKKYRLKELDLDMMHTVSPLLIRYRELFYKYTCNIDTTRLDAAENEIIQLKNAIKECGSTDNILIGKLNLKLKKAEEELRSNELVKQRKYINDTEALALFEIITDTGFMVNILNNILQTTDTKLPPAINAYDINNKDAAGFIKNVIADFFLLTAMSS